MGTRHLLDADQRDPPRTPSSCFPPLLGRGPGTLHAHTLSHVGFWVRGIVLPGPCGLHLSHNNPPPPHPPLPHSLPSPPMCVHHACSCCTPVLCLLTPWCSVVPNISVIFFITASSSFPRHQHASTLSPPPPWAIIHPSIIVLVFGFTSVSFTWGHTYMPVSLLFSTWAHTYIHTL